MTRTPANTEPTCSLTPETLHERRKMLRETIAPHIVSQQTLASGLRLVFARNETLHTEVENLVNLERQCCGFLTFDLTTSDQSLILTIEGPPQARETLAMFAKIADDPPTTIN